MGNAQDQTSNHQLMAAYNKHVLQFIKGEILFNVEDITFPLSTNGMRIVDVTGRRVKLAGGNWSGGHLCRQCVDGLEMRPMRDIALDIRYKFKMNCIRLPYSLQLFFYNKLVEPKYLKANPELIGKTALQIFDITVKTLTDVGLMVILNNHTSTSMWCCSNDDGDGLWWSREFPEYKFFQSCEQLAKRYKDNPRVVGMDLRNQLRKAHGVEATWGGDNPVTDWKRAAKISGEKVLSIAPHWLIFVGGLNYQLDLTAVLNSPLQYSVKNKLVYTGHFYGFSWPVPSWALVSYDSFKKKMFNTQTHVRGIGQGYPFLLGQFGNNQQDIPWNYIMRYLKETDIDWTYWALDGFKCDPSEDQTYGVFTNDFKNARHPEMLDDLIAVGPPAGTVISQRPQIIANIVENKQEKPKDQQELPKKLQQNHENKQKHQVNQLLTKEKPKIVQINNKQNAQIKTQPSQPRKQIIGNNKEQTASDKASINVQIKQQSQTLPKEQNKPNEAQKQKPKHKIFDEKYKKTD